MAGPLGRLRQRMARDWQLRQLRDERWRFLWDGPPPDEWVSFDCETTGLDTRHDEIVAIGAVRIRGQRIMTSERLELLVRPEKKVLSAESIRIHRLRGQDVEAGLPAGEAVERLLRAFNGECDAAITKVEYNDVQVMEARIRKAREAIGALAEGQQSESTRG